MANIKDGCIARHIEVPVVDLSSLRINFLLRLRFGNHIRQVVWVGEVYPNDEFVVCFNCDIIIILADILLIRMLFRELLHDFLCISYLLFLVSLLAEHIKGGTSSNCTNGKSNHTKV